MIDKGLNKIEVKSYFLSVIDNFWHFVLSFGIMFVVLHVLIFYCSYFTSLKINGQFKHFCIVMIYEDVKFVI